MWRILCYLSVMLLTAQILIDNGTVPAYFTAVRLLNTYGFDLFDSAENDVLYGMTGIEFCHPHDFACRRDFAVTFTRHTIVLNR